MSKIFEFMDKISGFFQWLFNFIIQMIYIVHSAISIVYDLLETAVYYAPVLTIFFVAFLSIAVALFIWRLIP